MISIAKGERRLSNGLIHDLLILQNGLTKSLGPNIFISTFRPKRIGVKPQALQRKRWFLCLRTMCMPFYY